MLTFYLLGCILVAIMCLILMKERPNVFEKYERSNLLISLLLTILLSWVVIVSMIYKGCRRK